ncbi:MAG: histidine phosphatase family protein [Candidatus Acidiferrales bacterium]|jgi:broad specificity phosphatase PhoE
MGTLYLVRHGQASFLADNYDKLSVLGETQARLLGEYWARRGLVFDRACVGPCVRQKDTLTLVSAAYEKAGLKFPEPLVMPEFDEYQGEAVLKRSLPALLEKDQRIRELYAAFESSTGTAERRVTFQKLFELVIGKWVRGEISPQGVETWLEFCSRVNSGLSKFLSAGARGERVAIFSSGGPIAVAMQRALHLSSERALQASWMSRNSSWSEFLYSTELFTLSSFNVLGHLDDPAMMTYR